VRGSYLEPEEHDVTCECLRCGHQYTYRVKKLTAKDRPCPRKACKAAALEEEIERRARNMAQIIEERRPPGIIGDKPIVKAIDTTAQIVMEDNNLTDLNDNMREGDSAVPRQSTRKQAEIDNFFNPKGAMDAFRGRGAPGVPASGSVASSLNRMVKNSILQERAVIPTVINGNGRQPGEPALTLARTVRNPGAGPNAA
jgi:hypothetical protein